MSRNLGGSSGGGRSGPPADYRTAEAMNRNWRLEQQQQQQQQQPVWRSDQLQQPSHWPPRQPVWTSDPQPSWRAAGYPEQQSLWRSEQLQQQQQAAWGYEQQPPLLRSAPQSAPVRHHEEDEQPVSERSVEAQRAAEALLSSSLSSSVNSLGSLHNEPVSFV